MSQLLIILSELQLVSFLILLHLFDFVPIEKLFVSQELEEKNPN